MRKWRDKFGKKCKEIEREKQVQNEGIRLKKNNERENNKGKRK